MVPGPSTGGPVSVRVEIRSSRLARDVVKKIEEQLQYPGQIKVTVIRETRAVDYAR